MELMNPLSQQTPIDKLISIWIQCTQVCEVVVLAMTVGVGTKTLFKLLDSLQVTLPVFRFRKRREYVYSSVQLQEKRVDGCL